MLTSHNVGYGDTIDPFSRANLTYPLVPLHNVLLNAPWEEWREDRLCAERLCEVCHGDPTGVGRSYGESKGWWLVNKELRFEGTVKIRENGLVLKDEGVGSMVVSWEKNVDAYCVDGSNLSFRVVCDPSVDGSPSPRSHPVTGLLGSGVAPLTSEIWVTIENVESEILRMWKEFDRPRYHGLRADDDQILPIDRCAFEVEVMQGPCGPRSPPQRCGDCVFIIGLPGSSLAGLEEEIKDEFDKVLKVNEENFSNVERIIEEVKSRAKTLVVVQGFLDSRWMVRMVHLSDSVNILGVTVVVNWRNIKYDNSAISNCDRCWMPFLWNQSASSYTTSVLLYTCSLPKEKDLLDASAFTAALGKTSYRPNVFRTTHGSLDIDIRSEICNGGKFYDEWRQQLR